MAKDITFKQMLLIATIPAAISGLSAYYAQSAERSSSNIKFMQSIVQARLTERDLINHDGIDKEKISFLIPVADNRSWSEYFNCRKDNNSRYYCATRQKILIPSITPELISQKLEVGYD